MKKLFLLLVIYICSRLICGCGYAGSEGIQHDSPLPEIAGVKLGDDPQPSISCLELIKKESEQLPASLETHTLVCGDMQFAGIRFDRVRVGVRLNTINTICWDLYDVTRIDLARLRRDATIALNQAYGKWGATSPVPSGTALGIDPDDLLWQLPSFSIRLRYSLREAEGRLSESRGRLRIWAILQDSPEPPQPPDAGGIRLGDNIEEHEQAVEFVPNDSHLRGFEETYSPTRGDRMRRATRIDGVDFDLVRLGVNAGKVDQISWWTTVYESEVPRLREQLTTTFNNRFRFFGAWCDSREPQFRTLRRQIHVWVLPGYTIRIETTIKGDYRPQHDRYASIEVSATLRE